ncbi:hypothetical protein [Hoeflea poritis]|uniref:Uncharacterized protein n=1 Tax=Hoeflea poritis TaxID=2993659 RepID=A0ABT4VR78_9HYPH|nr:hypothetical protein [Hoeflea poritis]MDA4846592.1 hypothetical protein [Hoeflea poritis]
MKHLIVLTLVLLPVSAAAGQAEANACAAGLDAPAKQIYDASAPHVTPTSDLHDVVRQQARSLVVSGQMTRQVAQANAMSAGKCLQKLQS